MNAAPEHEWEHRPGYSSTRDRHHKAYSWDVLIDQYVIKHRGRYKSDVSGREMYPYGPVLDAYTVLLTGGVRVNTRERQRAWAKKGMDWLYPLLFVELHEKYVSIVRHVKSREKLVKSLREEIKRLKSERR